MHMEKSIFSPEYQQFLKLLRKAREESGLTQSDLAQRLGQTQSFVSKVERGEGRLDVAEFRAFSVAIGVELHYGGRIIALRNFFYVR